MSNQIVHEIRRNPRIGDFERAFGVKLNQSIRKELQEAGKAAVALLKIESQKIFWKHRFQKGWKYTANTTTLTIYNSQPHAIYVELGRRPGARPPPASAILDWVRDKLGGGMSVAYLVAKKIGRDGIPPRPVLTNPVTQKLIATDIERRLTRMVDEAFKAASRI